ncbi:MAG TPA: hypothetical protein VGH20_15750 [Myxococcales bacterium]
MATAVLLACGCAAARQPAEPAAPDASFVRDADAGTPEDAGVVDVGTDAGSTPAAGQDAGPSDVGRVYSPLVGADGGEMRLVVDVEPGSSCASLMPEPVDAVVTDIDISPNRLFWFGGTTNGRGDLLITAGTDCCNFFATASDGGVQRIAEAGPIVPQADNFLFDSIEQGACLICNATLMTYPGAGIVPLGTGLADSKNCSFAARTERDGAYVSCTGPFLPEVKPPTFSRYDASLGLVWTKTGNGNWLVGVDAQDKLLEANLNDQWRWVDESLTPLSEWFSAGGFPSPLIGGGFLDGTTRVIPSGSAAVMPVPDWLAARSGVNIVRGGRAYALSAGDCALEIRDPAGTLCGAVTIVNCRRPPSASLDGSITMDTNQIGASSQTRYVTWPRLLR